MADRTIISEALSKKNLLQDSSMPWLGNRLQGKVRDVYERNDEMVFIASDRQSAFDKNIAYVPFKGAVLTQASVFWFQQTAHLIKNHLKASPDPNVMVGEKLQIFPIEFVMRGYLTGVTSTSVWTAYRRGERNYCGHRLPEGMKKNQAFEKPLLTPTTKGEVDEKISREEILDKKIMSEAHWEQCAEASHKLFAYGAQYCRKQGMILVDTKYEFGLDKNKEVRLADEIHTPDSSRFWIASTYAELFRRGEDPENIDKEFLRRWISEQCDPYKEAIPSIPHEMIVELSSRYVQLYERITGKTFVYSKGNIAARVEENLKKFFNIA